MPADDRFRHQVALLVRILPLARPAQTLSAFFPEGEPEWSLLEVPHARTLPVVRWQMTKLERLDERERAALVARLETALADSRHGDPAAATMDSEGWHA